MGTMKTENPVESTDELTKVFSSRIEYKVLLVLVALFFLSSVAALIAYLSQIITDYEENYSILGILIGLYVSFSVKMIPFVLCVIIEDWKYRCKIFSLFRLRDITMAVMASLTLYTWFYMIKEDFIMIHGHKCPLQKLIFTIVYGFFGGIAYLEFLRWSNLGSKIIQKDIMFLRSIISDDYSICPQCSAKNSFSNEVIKLESKIFLV
ncbi:uncharacterized protein LOC130676364 [Microplitis mediator]|uniref:uncharacterized protein LOC130676364 n=1 Tax=Microplitis mediator TaxID=375433 RepID=UPI002553192E|nr:uncharacterized protein LOC130676364 [Microplitis mediator]